MPVAHPVHSTREMSAVLTSRDYALRLTLWLVVATEALVLALLVLLNGEAPNFSWPVAATTLALLAVSLAPTRLSLAIIALAVELISLPSTGKLSMLLAGLHAAQVATGAILIAWALALPRWRRTSFTPIVKTYWYFTAIAWLVVGPVVH